MRKGILQQGILGCIVTATTALALAAMVHAGDTKTFSGCGQLVPGPQGCLYFNSDDGQGFALVVDSIPFTYLDGLHVSGEVMVSDEFCFPVTVAALLNVTAESCESDPDLNNDGSVNGPDLLNLLNAWGPAQVNVAGSTFTHPADFDRDGVIGGSDLLFMLNNWG